MPYQLCCENCRIFSGKSGNPDKSEPVQRRSGNKLCDFSLYFSALSDVVNFVCFYFCVKSLPGKVGDFGIRKMCSVGELATLKGRGCRLAQKAGFWG